MIAMVLPSFGQLLLSEVMMLSRSMLCARSAGCGFKNVALGMIPTLKVETHLPLLAVENVATKHANRVLAEIKMEAERVLGSFRQKEYDALKVANIPNGGCLNRVLE
jgi:hypothetical protein